MSLRLPQQPSKPIKLPSTASSSASTTVLPSLSQPTTTSASPSLTSSLTSRTCSVCCRHAAVYTCPRCNVCTCSLACYKQHSQRCVQEFAGREERGLMTGARVDDDTKRDTIAMLQRVQQRHDAGEDDTAEDEEASEQLEGDDEELARLLAAVHDDKLGLSSLSPEQQRHFLRAVHDGSLSRHITMAVPWWVPKLGRRLDEAGEGQQERELRDWEPSVEKTMVEEVDQVQSDEERQTTVFVQSLPPLSSILPTEPSPALPYHVVELVYGYCYLYRLYNGEPHTDLPAFLSDLVTLAPSLAPTATTIATSSHYQSTATTLHHCLAHTRTLPSLFQSPQFSALVLRDCSHACLNPATLQRLLCEVAGWCGGVGGMRRVGKKVWFFGVWLKDRGGERIRRVGEEARVVWKEAEAEAALLGKRGKE